MKKIDHFWLYLWLVVALMAAVVSPLFLTVASGG